MVNLNCLDFNILKFLELFSFYLSTIDVISTVKIILLTSSIIGKIAFPVLFSGAFKKGAQSIGKIINGVAIGGTAYVVSKEIGKDLKGYLDKNGFGINSGNYGNNTGKSGKNSTPPNSG
jgi:hypothetical protein